MNKFVKLTVFVLLAAFLIMPLGASADHNSGQPKSNKKCEKAQKYLEKSQNAKNEKYAQKYYDKYEKYSKYCDKDGKDKCDKALKYLAKSEAVTKPKYVEKYYQKYLKYSKYCDGEEEPNSPPVALNHSYPAVVVGGTFTGDLDDLPGTDLEDGSALLQRVIVDQPNVGSLIMHSDGTFTFIAPSSSGTNATFTFKVIDTDGAVSGIATVTIPIVDPPNTPPVASDYTYPAVFVGNNFTASLIDLPFSDTEDTDKNNLTVVIVSQPNVGTLTVNGNGTITYVAPGEEEPDGFFTYKVIDSKGAESNVATVYIPIIANDDF